MNRKYIAKQVDPYFQTSPFEWYDADDYSGIVFIGNRNFSQLSGTDTDVYDNVRKELTDGYLFDYLQTAGDDEFYKTQRDVIEDYFPRATPYTDDEIRSIVNLVNYFCAWNITVCQSENDIIVDLLRIIDGRFWKTTTLHGCCQSEWIDIIYDGDEWTDAALRQLEAEFFNTGSEFILNEIGDDGNEYDVTTVYTVRYFAGDVKEEISGIIGCSVDDLELWYFDGYTQTPKYKIS